MPRNPSDLTSAEKAVALYSLLLFTGRRYCLTELANRFGISKQTVYRLVERINAQGPVKVLSGKAEGRLWFRAEAPPARPTVTLSPAAIRRLLLCRDLVAHLLPEEVRSEVEATATCSTALLADPGQRELATAPVASAVPRGRVDYSRCRSQLDSLSDAIARRRLCRVTYKAPTRAAPREHLVAPLRLVAHHDALYLRCRPAWPGGEPQPDRGPMLLAVHRLRTVDVTDWPSRARDERGGSSQGLAFGLAERERVRARVAFRGWAANHVAERVWSDDQTLSETEDGVTLEFTARSRGELVTWVLGFAELAEVLAPPDLRAEVAARLAKGSAVYRENPITVPSDGTAAAHALPGHDDPSQRGERAMVVEKIVSGGQTGADRAALDVALELGIAVGGWCPRGRKAEDGEIAIRYRLRQTPSESYSERTKWNVRDADGTLVFRNGKPGRGTLLTIRTAEQLGKPCLVVPLSDAPDPEAIRTWLAEHRIRVLNVAGPRESTRPGTYREVAEVLRRVVDGAEAAESLEGV